MQLSIHNFIRLRKVQKAIKVASNKNVAGISLKIQRLGLDDVTHARQNVNLFSIYHSPKINEIQQTRNSSHEHLGIY